MSINSINKRIPDILIEKKYSVLRRIIVLLIPLIITFSMHLNGKYKSEYAPFYESIALLLVFIGIIYLNMCVLVPKLLLKNNFFSYFTSLLGCVFITFFIISYIQFTFHNVKMDYNSNNYARILFNVISACITFGIIIICSSTFIILRNWIVYNKRIR